MRGKRALLGVLSIGAVLVPAFAIAYLGAVSYRDDRGIVAAKVEESFRAAWDVARSIETELSGGLDAAEDALAEISAESLEALANQHPIAARPFRLDSAGHLVYPPPDPLRRGGPVGTAIDSVGDEPCLGALATCMRKIRAAELRRQQLENARMLETGDCPPAGECKPTSRGMAEARRLYKTLASFDDTGAAALIGLARLAVAAGERANAVAAYDRLDAEFGARANADGIRYSLLAEIGRAEAGGDAAAVLAIYERLIARDLEAPSAALEAIAGHVAARLQRLELTAEQAGRVEELAAALSRARDAAGFASTFVGELDDVFQTAGPKPRGRPSLLSRDRTLVFRRLGDGGVIGLVVENRMLAASARRANDDARAESDNAQAQVHRLGEPPDRDRVRTMASASFGPLLPHLMLSLVVDSSLPDPLDEIVEQRGRRHLALTGGLMLLLVIGLVATIRGAARERELARLKSEFVSTVSHELKTPLTSIRMFAEMLQQGVAGEDRDRQERYHEIIVKESERLGLLIANLLDYSQIERGTRRYARADESLVEIAREALDTFGRIREGEQKSVELDVADGAEAAQVFVDREVIVQSVLNLLSNAAKYGGGEPIVVVVRARNLEGSISVVDAGPGIDPSEHEKIFREFYRAPSAYKLQVEGTGLGLALVKRHVEAHEGRVELSSSEGEGAAFSIVLPRVEQP